MNSPPPKPSKPEPLGQLSPQQERQVQHWQRMAAPRPSRGVQIPWRLVAWGLGLWASFLLMAIAAFFLLSHPRYAGFRQEEHRDRPSPWMGVVIVVSCAGGTVLLGHWFERQRRR